MKTLLYRVSILLIVCSLFHSCERELQEYDFIRTERCVSDNVVLNPFIITDFECQSNVEISGVSVIRNPSETGINLSSFVGEYIDGTSATDGLSINFDSAIDLSTNAVFNLKVKTRTTGTLEIQLTNTLGQIMSYTIVVTGNDIWTQYDFDLTEVQNEDFIQIDLIFNSGITTNGDDVYLIDDLKFDVAIDPCEDIVEDLSVINDFDCQQNYFLGDNTAQTDVPRIDNPFIQGINQSAHVGRYEDDGTAPFDNFQVVFDAPIDLTDNSLLKLKVYATTSGPLLAKLEGGTPIEVFANITVLNQWVEYTFDFSLAANGGNDRLVLFFNAGETDGTNADIYYLDDIRFESDDCSAIIEDCTGVTQDLNIINDFDCQQNYNLGNDPTINDAPTVQNPNVSCQNRSSNVGRYVDDGTMPFDNLFINLNTPIDLSVNSTFRMKVLAANVAPVLAKLEGGTPAEVFADITVAGDWVELSFNFASAMGAGNDKLVLFFNAGQVNGTAMDIYYIDDMRFEAP